MRVGGGALAVALGLVLLWAVTQGYTKNLMAAWNALRGAGSTGGAGAFGALPNISINVPPMQQFPLPVLHTSFPAYGGGTPPLPSGVA